MRSVGRVLPFAVGLVGAIVALVGVVRLERPSGGLPVSGGPIAIDSVAVPLNPEHPEAQAVGDFLYAGGLVLTSQQTDQLHGLSELEVTGADRLTAISDFGALLQARIVLDGAGRLAGLADARIAPLTGESGKPLANKADADAEGLALLPGGRLVSFERNHRIWFYPADGGPPRPAPKPGVLFPTNEGMEALAADPAAGPDAYVVAGEMSGRTWTCRLSSSSCVEGPVLDKPGEFGVVAVRRLPDARSAYLLRAFDAERGNRISLQILRETTEVARLDLAAPMTVDNFEGIGVVPQADGALRFYLLSDDNALPHQRTILLAFDWRPR